MSGKGAKRPLRVLTASEKLAAIQRVHEGASKASVARDLGVPESTLRGWCKNEEKIAYQSTQSSPVSDESPDHSPTKNQKLEEPKDKSRANQKLPTTPPKTQDNKAELARIRNELALSMPDVNGDSSNYVDPSTNVVLAHWNTFYNMQHQMLQSHCNKTSSVVSPSIGLLQKAIVNGSNVVSSTLPQSFPAPSGGLLTTVDQRSKQQQQQLQQLPDNAPSVNESVWSWLTSQQATFNKQQTSNQSLNNSNGLGVNDKSWGWAASFYKHFAKSQQQEESQEECEVQQPHWSSQDVQPPLQELYTEPTSTEQVSESVQLPLDTPPEQDEAENLCVKATKSRNVLDNLLFENNNVTDDEKDENAIEMDQAEAVRHAEIFMKWLQTHGSPSVTATQLTNFRTIINNVQMDIERKNGSLQNKTKGRRK